MRSPLVRLLAGCAIAACVVLVAGCGKEAPPPPRAAPEVTVVTVTPTTIPFTPTFVAQTESSRQVNIVARVSGFLERIAYQEGDLVKQGQLMFTLDQKPFSSHRAARSAPITSSRRWSHPRAGASTIRRRWTSRTRAGGTSSAIRS